jgi:condensin complex subunit 2
VVCQTHVCRCKSHLTKENKRTQDTEEGEEGEGEDPEEQKEKKARKRVCPESSMLTQAARAEATLVKDFSAIQIKKFDLEFSVDPLFKKTSADFDEGGAKGLLLNHLSLDKDLRIVFDAGDTVLEENNEEEQETSQVVEHEIDLSTLQCTSSLSLADKAQFFTDLTDLDNLDICPSLKNFEFSSDKVLELPFLKLQSEIANQEPDDYLFADRTIPGGPLSFPDDGGSDGGFGEGGFGDEPFGEGFNTATDDFGMAGPEDPIMPEVEGNAQGFEKVTDLTGGQGKFVMALSGLEGENILSYFDERGGKNWAGPEHWRIQKIKKGTFLFY